MPDMPTLAGFAAAVLDQRLAVRALGEMLAFLLFASALGPSRKLGRWVERRATGLSQPRSSEEARPAAGTPGAPAAGGRRLTAGALVGVAARALIAAVYLLVRLMSLPIVADMLLSVAIYTLYLRLFRDVDLKGALYAACVCFISLDFVRTCVTSVGLPLAVRACLAAGADVSLGALAALAGQLALMCLVCWLMGRVALRDQLKHGSLSWGDLLLVLLPMLPYVFIKMEPSFYSEDDPAARRRMLAILMLQYPVCLAMVVGVRSSMAAKAWKAETLQLQALMEEQGRQYLVRRDAMEQVREQYHDLRHFLTGLEGAVDSERLARSVEDYARRLDLAPEVRTGNAVVDVVVAEKARACAEERISLIPYVSAQGAGFMNDLDLCSLFGNAIDNAIEATRLVADPELREIRVKAGVVGGVYALTVTNHYAAEPVEGEGGLVSTKAGEGHGLGLRSMRHVVESYGGGLSVAHRDGLFTLSAVVPCPVGQGPSGRGPGRAAA